MTKEGECNAEKRTKDHLIDRVCAKIHPTKAHENQENDSCTCSRHFDNVSRAKDGHSWLFHSNFVISVQIDGHVNEDVIGHVTRWIAKA